MTSIPDNFLNVIHVIQSCHIWYRWKALFLTRGGQYVHFFGWPSLISLAQNFFEFSWSTDYKNTFILKIDWNFAWLSTFSRQKVKILHFKRKMYLNRISNLNFSSVFTPNAYFCLLLQFDTKISKCVWPLAKNYCIEHIFSQIFNIFGIHI